MANKRRILEALAMLFDDDPPPKLVGIARLAASSDLLEAKRQVEYLELETRRFIGRGSGRMRSMWTINPYRGCEYRLQILLCPLRARIHGAARSGAVRAQNLRQTISGRGVSGRSSAVEVGDTVWIGTATDPYQPAERRFQITRQMLEVFAGERGLDFGITTKSDFVARDAALMARIARKNRIRVHLTITTLDEESGPPDRAARAASRFAFERGQEADRSRRAGERSGASRDAADQ